MSRDEFQLRTEYVASHPYGISERMYFVVCYHGISTNGLIPGIDYLGRQVNHAIPVSVRRN
jgi:hypothetical protein